jgi:hypothetical protein
LTGRSRPPILPSLLLGIAFGALLVAAGAVLIAKQAPRVSPAVGS